MIDDHEWEILKTKISKEFPLRLRLAELADRPQIDPRNYRSLERFDDTVAELFLEIAIKKPTDVWTALEAICDVRGRV